MTPTPDDQLARRIAAHLGDKPEVSSHVAAQLARARATAVAKAREQRMEVDLGTTRALRKAPALRLKLALIALCAVLVSYGSAVSNQDPLVPTVSWHTVDDSTHYVDLLQDQ